MKNVILKLFAAVTISIMGAAFLEEILTDPTAEIGEKIFLSACGILLIFTGVAVVAVSIHDAYMKKKRLEGKRVSDIIKEEIAATLLPDFTSVGDADHTQRQLTSFREHYRKFFLEDGDLENAAIQTDVTQIFRNILELQRLRLSKKNVRFDFSSERKRYREEPVKVTEEFDGKYEIRDIHEDIAAKSVFTCGNRKIFQRISAETAHYTVINARQTGKDSVICPSCGVETDRVKLLDGCDYCKTKFRIEDLGEKISDFSLQKNEEVEYKKYVAFRNKTNRWLALLIGLIAGGYTTYWMVQLALEAVPDGDTTPLLDLMASIFVVLFFTGVSIFFGLLFFDLLILPFIQLGAYGRYLLKRMRSKRKRSDAALICLDRIREWDPLFSFASFSSGLTNKLATILYADTKQQAETFFQEIESLDTERYKNVIDMDVLDMEPMEFKVQNSMQHLWIRTSLNLVEYNGRVCRQRLEHIKLHLEKSEHCKTQAVCAPAVMRCGGCGSSRLLLEGKTCRYCGSQLDLRQYDWVIRNMEYGIWQIEQSFSQDSLLSGQTKCCYSDCHFWIYLAASVISIQQTYYYDNQ